MASRVTLNVKILLGLFKDVARDWTIENKPGGNLACEVNKRRCLLMLDSSRQSEYRSRAEYRSSFASMVFNPTPIFW